MAAFLLSGLDPQLFASLFEPDDAALHARHARRVVATAAPGFPCRVSLEDARVGEELLLLQHMHQPAHSPCRGAGPIYVRRGAVAARLAPGQVPDCVATWPISLRAYDAADLIVAAEVCPGGAVGPWLQACLDDPQMACVHLHNARRGCHACRADRVAAAG